MKRIDAPAASPAACEAPPPALREASLPSCRASADRTNAAEKKLNRRSFEFPQRKIFDAQCVLDKVKKSYSFDQQCDGDIVAKIVEDRFASAISRKVQLADDKCERLKPRVKLVNGARLGDRSDGQSANDICSETRPDESERKRKFGIKLFSGYLNGNDNKVEDRAAGKARPRIFDLASRPRDSAPDGRCGKSSLNSAGECSSGVHLRPRGQGEGEGEGPRTEGEAGARCRSSPPWGPGWAPPWAAERAGGRLCRTWYAGYGTLAEDDDFSTEQTLTDKTLASSTVAAAAGSAGPDAGARRRAEGRRRARPPASLRLSASALSLNMLPRLSAAVIPLRRGGLARSAATLLEEHGAPLLPADGAPLRKCETMAALGGAEPQRPVNRLRVCSRCSSLLSLAAGGSRYSLAAGGFVAVPGEPSLLCKLCLEEVPRRHACTIAHCGCSFCTKCMQAYAEYEIMNGAYDISCPDSRCPGHGVMAQPEVEALVSPDVVDKHRKFRLNHEVAMDGGRAFCPRVGCETVCRVPGGYGGSGAGSTVSGGPGSVAPQAVRCPTCEHYFCSACTNQWHAGMDCVAYSRQQALEAVEGLPAESDLIKWCPMCRVPIEKDEGCAQMMCKRCKHVFCWYCLASLDDDFLLRHYDKGPCKNKLGHSRASVIWHRAQVVGIFAGFGLLLLVASPLLLLAAPCIVCCKCRLCNTNGGKTIDGDEAEGMDIEAEDLMGDEIQKITSPVID